MFFRKKKVTEVFPQVEVKIKNFTDKKLKKEFENIRHMIWKFPDEIPPYGELVATFNFINDPDIPKEEYYGRARYLSSDFQDLQIQAYWGKAVISYYPEKLNIEPVGDIMLVEPEETIQINIDYRS